VRGNAASPAKVRASAPVAKDTPKKSTASKPAAKKPAVLTKNGADYTVVAGDTLSKLAARHHVAGGWHALFERNKDVLSNPNVLRIGQQLDLR
jgi:LysM repeat protein